jgi:hypothetical protein
MRAAAAVLIVASVTLPGSAQLHAQAQLAPSGPTIRLAAAAAKKKSAPAPQPSAYASMPLTERATIQYDLAWTGDYNGLINGEFNDRSIAAVKSFQKNHTFKETGVLAAPERAVLAAAAKTKQEQVGWRMVDDKVTGAQVGLPTKHVPNTSAGKTGTRWSSAQGQIQVETFRIREPGTTLASVFEQQKKEPANRRVVVNFLRPDFFILSGMQGLKKFYVRAEIKQDEVRGMTILYDQATEGIMDSVAVVMSSAFAPFPGSGIATLIGPPPRRKVEYATGIIVTPAGDIVTDRQVTEGCNVIEISGRGDAERVADGNELALLRVYGAPDLAPAALVHDGAKGPDLTLVGIADPQAQGGGGATSTATARLNGEGLQPLPPAGFAGAAAIDGQGRLFGMVALTNPVVASTGPASPPQATIIPVDAMRKFLEAQSVTPTSGSGGVTAAKAALVRVICVRR